MRFSQRASRAARIDDCALRAQSFAYAKCALRAHFQVLAMDTRGCGIMYKKSRIINFNFLACM